jgi:membrane protein YqaA with SNARE-associated domain
VLFYLVTLLVFIPSPLLQFINAEAWAIFVGLSGTRSVVLLGIALGAAQTIGFSGLYLFGDRLLSRSKKLRSVFERFDAEKLRTRAPWALACGSVLGLPPQNAMALAAPLMGVRLRTLLVISFIGRCIRYIVLGAAAQWFAETFGIKTDWIPEWLRTLV